MVGEQISSFVTVHKCDGRDLGSTALKMAAGSTLNDAVKYVLSGLTFCRGKFTVAKKGDKTCVPKQQMLQLFQKLEDVATKKWSQNMLTKPTRDILRPLSSEI